MNLLVWTVTSNLRNCAPWGASPCLAPNVLPEIPKEEFLCSRRKAREVKELNQLAVPILAVHAMAEVAVLAIKSATNLDYV